jgi:hypothetical protein
VKAKTYPRFKFSRGVRKYFENVTAWSRVLEKLLKAFPTFHASGMFIAVYKTALHHPCPEPGECSPSSQTSSRAGNRTPIPPSFIRPEAQSLSDPGSPVQEFINRNLNQNIRTNRCRYSPRRVSNRTADPLEHTAATTRVAC